MPQDPVTGGHREWLCIDMNFVHCALLDEVDAQFNGQMQSERERERAAEGQTMVSPFPAPKC